MELLRFAQAQATDAVARCAPISELNDIRSLISRVDPANETERYLAETTTQMLRKAIDPVYNDGSGAGVYKPSSSIENRFRKPPVIISADEKRWSSIWPTAVVVRPEHIVVDGRRYVIRSTGGLPIEAAEPTESITLDGLRLTETDLIVDAPGLEEEIFGGSSKTLAGMTTVAFRFGTESIGRGCLLDVVDRLVSDGIGTYERTDMPVDADDDRWYVYERLPPKPISTTVIPTGKPHTARIRTMLAEARQHRESARNREAYEVCMKILTVEQPNWHIRDEEILTESVWTELAIVCFYVGDIALGRRAADRCADIVYLKDFAFQCLWFYTSAIDCKTIATIDDDDPAGSIVPVMDDPAVRWIKLSFQRLLFLDAELKLVQPPAFVTGLPFDDDDTDDSKRSSATDGATIKRLLTASSKQIRFIVQTKNGLFDVVADKTETGIWTCRPKTTPVDKPVSDSLPLPATLPDGTWSIGTDASPLTLIGSNKQYVGGPGMFAQNGGGFIPFVVKRSKSVVNGYLGITRETGTDNVAFHRFVFYDDRMMPRRRSSALHFGSPKNETVLSVRNDGESVSVVLTIDGKLRSVRVDADCVRNQLVDLDVPNPWSVDGRPDTIQFRKLGHLGRLGNQLMQIAGTLSVGRRYSSETVIEFDGPFESAAYFKAGWHRSCQAGLWPAVRIDLPNPHSYLESLPLVVGGRSLEIAGYFQNAAWFAADPTIRSAFEPSSYMLDRIVRMQKSLRLRLPLSDYCAVHVRRGDYASYYESAGGPLCLPWSYYETAMRSIKSAGGPTKFLFFSEDESYLKRKLAGRSDAVIVPATSARNGGDLESLFVMAACGSLIISNSSYSWFAAYLSDLPVFRSSTKKTVVGPSPWFPHVAGSDRMHTNGWIVLPRGLPDADDLNGGSYAGMRSKSVVVDWSTDLPPDDPVMPVVSKPNIYPLPYAIPTERISATVPKKQQILADLLPGIPQTYRFGPGQQDDYYQMYGSARFGITIRKGGVDCLRHYEIAAAGCIPFFKDAEQTIPKLTMVTWPKAWLADVYKELMPWKPSYEAKYAVRMQQLLDYTRRFLSTDALADYVLDRIGIKNPKILLIRGDSGTNYSRETVAIGLRRKLGNRFIDVPKIEPLYRNCKNLAESTGFGYSYGGCLDDDPSIDRDRLDERIASREFDFVLYGRVGADEGPNGRIPNLPYWSAVNQVYGPKTIGFLFGGDARVDVSSPFLMAHAQRGIAFVRELSD